MVKKSPERKSSRPSTQTRRYHVSPEQRKRNERKRKQDEEVVEEVEEVEEEEDEHQAHPEEETSDEEEVQQQEAPEEESSDEEGPVPPKKAKTAKKEELVSDLTNKITDFGKSDFHKLREILLGFGGEIAARFARMDLQNCWKQYSPCLKHSCKLFAATNSIGSQSWIGLSNYFGKKITFDEHGKLKIVMLTGSDSGKMSCTPSIFECFVDPKLEKEVLAIETPSKISISDEHIKLRSSQYQFQQAAKWCSIITKWMSWDEENQDELRLYDVTSENFDFLFVSKVFLPLWKGIIHGSRCAHCFFIETIQSSVDGLLQGLTRVLPVKIQLAYDRMQIFSEVGREKKTIETFSDSHAAPQGGMVDQIVTQLVDNKETYGFPYSLFKPRLAISKKEQEKNHHPVNFEAKFFVKNLNWSSLDDVEFNIKDIENVLKQKQPNRGFNEERQEEEEIPEDGQQERQEELEFEIQESPGGPRRQPLDQHDLLDEANNEIDFENVENQPTTPPDVSFDAPDLNRSTSPVLGPPIIRLPRGSGRIPLTPSPRPSLAPQQPNSESSSTSSSESSSSSSSSSSVLSPIPIVDPISIKTVPKVLKTMGFPETFVSRNCEKDLIKKAMDQLRNTIPKTPRGISTHSVYHGIETYNFMPYSKLKKVVETETNKQFTIGKNKWPKFLHYFISIGIDSPNN